MTITPAAAPSRAAAKESAGVGTVPDHGGQYVGTGPESDGYKILDNALSQRLAANNALDTIATWAPREPEQVYTPLSTGAGQYRALGRMITLSRVDTVRKALQRSWDTLFANSTDSEMRSLRIPGAGKYNSNDQPIVLVVSSMAGGAGASMALDICRTLTLVQGVDPRLQSLADNGGPTRTYALGEGSPAIGAGFPAGERTVGGSPVVIPLVDQRICRALPPGHDFNKNIIVKSPTDNRCINILYVGGLGQHDRHFH